MTRRLPQVAGPCAAPHVTATRSTWWLPRSRDDRTAIMRPLFGCWLASPVCIGEEVDDMPTTRAAIERAVRRSARLEAADVEFHDSDAHDPPPPTTRLIAPLIVWSGRLHDGSGLADTTVVSTPRLTRTLSTSVPYNLPHDRADALADDGASGLIFAARFGSDEELALFGREVGRAARTGRARRSARRRRSDAHAGDRSCGGSAAGDATGCCPQRRWVQPHPSALMTPTPLGCPLRAARRSQVQASRRQGPGLPLLSPTDPRVVHPPARLRVVRQRRRPRRAAHGRRPRASWSGPNGRADG